MSTYPTGLGNAGTDHERERKSWMYIEVGEVYRAAAGRVSEFYRSAISRAGDGIGNAYRSAADFCREIPEYPIGTGALATGIATAVASLYMGDAEVGRLVEGAGALVSGAGLSCMVRGLFRGMEKKRMGEERKQWREEREAHYKEIGRLAEEVHSLSVSLQEQQRAADGHRQTTSELRQLMHEIRRRSPELYGEVLYGNGRTGAGVGLELTEEDRDELGLTAIEIEPERLEKVA